MRYPARGSLPALVELRDQFSHRLPEAEFLAKDLLDELIAKTTERGALHGN